MIVGVLALLAVLWAVAVYTGHLPGPHLGAAPAKSSPSASPSKASSAASTRARPTTTPLSPTQSPGANDCRTGDLKLELVDNASAGATGERGWDAIVTNTSGQACRLYGYPVTNLLASGRVTGRPGEPVTKSVPQELQLQPNDKAKATIVVKSTKNCNYTDADHLTVQVPNTAESTSHKMRTRSCSDRFDSALIVTAFEPV